MTNTAEQVFRLDAVTSGDDDRSGR
jgi:hypothetical protein